MRAENEQPVFLKDYAQSPYLIERVELDGSRHSPWVLEAEVDSAPATGKDAVASSLVIRLHYGGTLWTGGVLERALADDIARGREGLAAALSASPTR